MHKLHITYVFNLLELHNKKYYINKKRNKMINNILKFFDHSYKSMNFNTFDKVDPQLVKYFRTEYGQDWQSALTEHLYKKESSNAKKAA
tara:strand:- start:467 stop:733 length:267 start_codon:yes stop_codon:yes gene_type:complete